MVRSKPGDSARSAGHCRRRHRFLTAPNRGQVYAWVPRDGARPANHCHRRHRVLAKKRWSGLSKRSCPPNAQLCAKVGLAKPYIHTVYLVVSLPKIPYVHRVQMVLANPMQKGCHTMACH